MGRQLVKKIPTIAQLRRAVNSRSTSQAIVKGVSCPDGIMNATISEALPRAHRIEMGRLSFEFRVDLAIALGLLDPSDRAALLKIYKYRSTFAHSPDARLTSRQARDVYNLIPPKTRSFLGSARKRFEDFTSPRQFLAECLAVYFIMWESTIVRLRDRVARDHILAQIVREELESSRADRESRLDSKTREGIEKFLQQRQSEREVRIEQFVEAERKRRNALGQL